MAKRKRIWKGERDLYLAIKAAFGAVTRVRRNARPAFLAPQHLDVWLPQLRLGIEHHGAQHYEPVEFFGGVEGYRRRVRLDKRKVRVCVRNGVSLISVPAGTPHQVVIRHIHSYIRKALG